MNKEQLQQLAAFLTLQEKIKMIHGAAFFATAGIPEKNIPPFVFSDGPMGVRPEYGPDTWYPIAGNDDYTSYLPCNSALASTFNRQRVLESGEVLGLEARGRGKDMILAPGLNIHRSPLGGRNFEYMSEDPYLTAEMAVSCIKGVQKNDVAACAKHFALNNQETNRTSYSPVVSERALWEIYFPAFRACVKEGHVEGVMGAYNKFKGEFLCHQKELVNDILRGEWDFDGMYVSDWGAVHDTQKAVDCELDVEMAATNNFDDYYLASPLEKAVQEGRIAEADLDKKILRILGTMNRLHMLDGERKSGAYNLPSSRQTLLQAAEESVILLKNDDSLLPLAPKKLKKLLVIGDNADRTHASGGGSAEIKALYELTPLMGLKMLLGGNCTVEYEPGYYACVTGNAWEGENAQNAFANVGTSFASRQNRKVRDDEVAALNASYKEHAIAACKDADAVIFIGGLNHDHDVEARDRSDYHLPYGQDSLIKDLLKVRPDMIVTLIAGSPVSMEEWIADAKAVVFSYYNGMEGGLALAETLLGMVCPSGKLPTTFPVKLSDSPAHSLGQFPGAQTVNYDEGIMVGYRYYDTYHVKPQFAFGHGLSYTDFVYDDLSVSMTETPEGPACDIKLTVANISGPDAKESVQVYVAPLTNDCDKDLVRPTQELRAFDKKEIGKGERTGFSFHLDAIAFSYYDEASHSYKVPAGTYEIRVGSASDDIRLRKEVTVTETCFLPRS